MRIAMIVFTAAVLALPLLVACSRTGQPSQPAKKNIETCDLVPEVGQIFHWDVNELFNDKKTHKVESEEILARRGLLTLRLWTRNWDNGGVEILNPLHYGPVYIGDLEDFIEIDMVVDGPLLKQEVPNIEGTLAAIDADIRSGATAALIETVDAALKTRTPGAEMEYDFIRYPEVLRWREETEMIGFIGAETPAPLLVLDRIRTLGAEGEDTRSFWYAKDGCQFVRYTTSYIIPTSSQSSQSDLVRVEP